MVRIFVGVDYRWILPYSAILGAIIMLIADLVGRLVIQPSELPVGLVMPLIWRTFLYIFDSLEDETMNGGIRGMANDS